MNTFIFLFQMNIINMNFFCGLSYKSCCTVREIASDSVFCVKIIHMIG